MTKTCPGCSGSGTATSNPNVLTCNRCDGLFTLNTISWQEALEFVNLNSMQANADKARYFDFAIAGPSLSGGIPRRTHGWFDVATKKVVQFG